MTYQKRKSTRLELEALEDRQLLSTIPLLHSNPGAAHSLYLDFDGHFEPAWYLFENEENGATIRVPGYLNDIDVAPFSLDSDTTSFTPHEQDFIREVWQHVSEDFSPFRVDVTTEKPNSLYNGGDPTGKAIRVAIGKVDTVSSEALGFAFAGGTPNQYQDARVPNSVFVYAQKLDSAEKVGIAAAHEAGHAYGLEHIAFTREILTDRAFNRSAIMLEKMDNSVRNVWYEAKIAGTNTRQDPVAHLTSVLGRRSDDRGDDINSATPLYQLPELETSIGNADNRLYGAGVIENVDDMDYFVFPVVSTGQVIIRVRMGLNPSMVSAATQPIPANTPGYNLDAKVVIQDSNGNLIVEQDMAQTETFFTQAVLTRDLLGNGTNLTVGETYYVGVGSHGKYGDLGNYLITVDGPVAFGPRVKSAMAGTPTINGSSPSLIGVDRVWIEFDQPIDVRTFTADDVALHVPWSLSAVKPTAVNVMDPSDPRAFELIFPLETTPGFYTLTVGPNIQGIYGASNPYLNINYGLTMDQDRDGIGGEATEDQFVYRFEVRDSFDDFWDETDWRSVYDWECYRLLQETETSTDDLLLESYACDRL